MWAAWEPWLRFMIRKTKQVELHPPMLMLFSECEWMANAGVVLIYPAVPVGGVKLRRSSLSIPGLAAAWVEKD